MYQNYHTESSSNKRAAGNMKAARKRMKQIDCNDL